MEPSLESMVDWAVVQSVYVVSGLRLLCGVSKRGTYYDDRFFMSNMTRGI